MKAFVDRPAAMGVGKVKKPAPVGKRFGRLVVLAEGPRHAPAWPSGQMFRTWLCRCDCGTSKTVTMSNVVAGRTRSCGCALHVVPETLRNGLTRSENMRRLWAEQREQMARQ